MFNVFTTDIQIISFNPVSLTIFSCCVLIVKAGGMRVARARQSSTGESKESGGDGETEYSTT